MGELFVVNIKEEFSRHRNLINAYWAVNKEGEFEFSIKELQMESGLKRHEILKITKGSRISALKTKCMVCSEPFIMKTRTELRSYIDRGYDISKKEKPYRCTECKAKLEADRLRIRMNEAAEKRNKVTEILSNDTIRPIDLNEMKLIDLLYLLAIHRGGANEELESIMPIYTFEQPLTPNGLFDYEVATHLYDSRYIGIDPRSDLSNIEVIDEGLRFYPINVRWRPLFAKSGEEAGRVLSMLMEKVESYDWPEQWLVEAEEIWKKIAFYESLEYLLLVLNEYGIKHEPGEKVSQIITHLLRDFSVAEICCMIWSQMKTTAGWLARTRAPEANAPNYLLKCIQSHADKARKNDWEIKKFRRNFECPISLIAEILYDKILQIEGFSEVPKV